MKKGIITSILIAVALTAGLTGGAASADRSGDRAKILVKFHEGVSPSTTLRAYGLSVASQLRSVGVTVVSVPAEAEERVIAALSRNPGVVYAERDEVAHVATNDTFFDRQYALMNEGQSFANTNGSVTTAAGKVDADIDAVEAWSVTQGDGMRVAVLDSGVDVDHEDISSKVVGAANFTSAPTVDDNYGHGTHVAGIIAASTDNGFGVAGVCPGCEILNGKVLGDNGSGYTSDIVEGMEWAVANGAKVINLSLGARSTRTLEASVNKAWSQGAVIVAAAGNSGNQSKLYPAAYTNVIAVAATDNNDAKASFSNYGAKWVDIAAPGVNVYSTFPNHPFVIGTQNGRSQGYDIASGTSMASPVVAGVTALAWSTQPSVTNAAIRNKVQLSADAVAGTGVYWANGRVNADTAVRP